MERFRLPHDFSPAGRPASKGGRPNKERHFIRVPITWFERLAGVRQVATYHVALHLLYRAWRHGSRSAVLSNALLVCEGIPRWQKWRALRELERRGLITVERRQRRAPRVTLVLPS
jgi:hypothetical protein